MIVAVGTKIGQSGSIDIDRVELGEHVGQRKAYSAALRRRLLRKRWVSKDPTVEILHDVKRAADHVRVFALDKNAGHRKASASQSAQRACLAIDRMRGRLRPTGRLAAQHEWPGRGIEAVGRVRLAAGELSDCNAPRRVWQERLQKRSSAATSNASRSGTGCTSGTASPRLMRAAPAARQTRTVRLPGRAPRPGRRQSGSRVRP